jgi:inorganic triphosphatase YgiF
MVRRASTARSSAPASNPTPAENGQGRMPREIELKLFLPDDAEVALAAAPLLRDARPRRVHLDATYFDTPDRLLQKHGMALRLRRTGRQWVQTLKEAESARGGLSARPEWESPARLVRGTPRIDVTKLADTPLPALLARHRAQAKLQPQFRVRVRRTLWEIEFRGSRIEVAADRGHIEAASGGRPTSVPVAEIELELKDGRPEDLTAAALRLTGRGKNGLALVPMLSGKAERGYRLVSGKPVPPTKAAARGFVAALEADMTSSVALRAIVAHGLDVVLANTAALRDVHAPEYVHQARVALRRMRSAVRLLDRKHADFPETLARELRWAAQLLGAARDWDVLVTQTLPKLFANAPRELRGEVRTTLARAQAKRDAARTDVLGALGTARSARLALRLQAWTVTSPPKGRTLKRLAPRALGKAHRRLFDATQFFAALSPERRHRVRILAKRLRYALDVLSVALPREATERYIAALAELQDVLGELNDDAVAQMVLSRLSAASSIEKLATARLKEAERRSVEAAESRLRQLRQTSPAW